MLGKLGRWVFHRKIARKISIEPTVFPRVLGDIDGPVVFSSPSAWAITSQIYPSLDIEPILDVSIQVSEVLHWREGTRELNLADRDNPVIVGVGGGRVMDAAKAIARQMRCKCYLVPTILSTTAWLNPVASLKEGPKVHHAKGRVDRILLDPQIISQAKPSLNAGGLADLLCGFNGVEDWVLAHEKNGERMPNGAQKRVLGLCEDILANAPNCFPTTPDTVPTLVAFFLDAMQLCYELLSGRPLEGGEHLLYYAIEEAIDRPLNHGAVIALGTLVCLELRAPNRPITRRLKDFYRSLAVHFTTEHLKIARGDLERILEEMPNYVTRNKHPFSWWNVDDPFQNSSAREILDWLEQ